jgi:ubiquinone/menaquinone biosynthesis C-methylase UbiE
VIDFEALERTGWEGKARAYYDACRPITHRFIDRLLDAAGVGPGTRLLDVGTGPGDVAARAVERGSEAVGLDLAPAMVSLAAQVHPGLRFLVADAQEPPFEPASFDAVVGNFSFHHLPDQCRALEAWHRLLVSGGRLALTAWDEPGRNRLLGMFADAVASVPGAARTAGSGTPAMCDTDEGYRRALEAGGFRDVAVTVIEFTFRPASVDALWAGVLAATVRTAASVEALPPEVRSRVREVFDRLAAAHRSGDGLAVPVAAKLVSATAG